MSNENTILFNESVSPYRILTPQFEVPVEIDGFVYKSVEHYYQSEKFLHPDDKEIVKNSSTVSEAIRLGRVRIFELRHDWNNIKFNVLLKAMETRFNMYPEQKQMLLDTDDSNLVYDVSNCYWGKGLYNNGFNMYGSLLMKLRHQFRKGVNQ